ncbi:hypothetical protein BGX28_001441 [Mortierella sp. GBA30]|nr:hypothetical protein BGX28_001441 [Mortierella sp. GBA30]
MILFLFVVSPFMIYQLKGINDGFGIRNELKFISFFSAPCVVLFFLVPAVAYNITMKYLDRTTFMALILIASHVTSIIIPLGRHFKAYPHQCAYTAKAFHRKTHRRQKTTVAADASVSKVEIEDTKSESLPPPPGGTSTIIPGGTLKPSNHIVSSPISTSPPVRTFGISESGNQLNNSAINDYPLSEYGRQDSAGNPHISLKNLIRNQRRQRFGFGGSSQEGAIINSKKTDWDEFIKAIEDRRIFDRISAFTVGEFCAENTRFLYEVSRLEKRAMQYERLRSMTSAPQDASADVEGSAPTETRLPAPHRTGLVKSPSSDTNCSILPPLPVHFKSSYSSSSTSSPVSPPGPNIYSIPTPHRIKKIISASSVSSTLPMLAPRSSSSSFFDDSEPPSPPRPYPHSTFRRYGSSSSALPDLEEGIVEHNGTDGSTLADSTSYIDVVNMPKMALTPLPMPPTLLTQFEYVYKTFIAYGGRLELNLSYSTAQEIHIKAKRGEWHSGIFDGAIYEIQELLFRDVWPKFVTSSHGLLCMGSSTSLGSNRDPTQEARVGSGRSNTGSSARSSNFLPPEHQLAQPSALSPSISSPKASVSRAVSRLPTLSSVSDVSNTSRRGSTRSFKTQQGCNDDEFYDEPGRTGLRTWLSKKNRTGYTAATLMSREGSTEEARGIIEQSRKSMGNRRSDTSGLYSTSIQNSMMSGNPPSST